MIEHKADAGQTKTTAARVVPDATRPEDLTTQQHAVRAVQRVSREPRALPASMLLALQRTAGNAAVNRLLQSARRPETRPNLSPAPLASVLGHGQAALVAHASTYSGAGVAVIQRDYTVPGADPKVTLLDIELVDLLHDVTRTLAASAPQSVDPDATDIPMDRPAQWLATYRFLNQNRFKKDAAGDKQTFRYRLAGNLPIEIKSQAGPAKNNFLVIPAEGQIGGKGPDGQKLLPDDTPFHRATYDALLRKLDLLKDQHLKGLTDQHIARDIEALAQGTPVEENRAERSLRSNVPAADPHKRVSYADLIGELTTLLFSVEPQRNYATFGSSVMILDLVKSGMTWAEALGNATQHHPNAPRHPMAGQDAVKSAGDLEEERLPRFRALQADRAAGNAAALGKKTPALNVGVGGKEAEVLIAWLAAVPAARFAAVAGQAKAAQKKAAALAIVRQIVQERLTAFYGPPAIPAAMPAAAAITPATPPPVAASAAITPATPPPGMNIPASAPPMPVAMAAASSSISAPIPVRAATASSSAAVLNAPDAAPSSGLLPTKPETK